MKIRVVYMSDAPYAGGAERYITLLVRHLDRSLFAPGLVVADHTGLDQWVEGLREDGLTVYKVAMDLPFSPHHIPGILSALGRIEPHIVHVNLPGPYDGQMGLLVPLARVGGAARVVVTEHLPMVEKLWKRALFKQTAYSWVDRVLTVCRANVPYLMEKQGVREDKIEVIHNGLPIAYGGGREELRPVVRGELGLENEVALVVVGSLIKRKGHRLLIEALGPLRGLRWRLFLVGEGEERMSLEGLVRALNLSDRVVFMGTMAQDRVERILSAMDILVLPSLLEALPYALLEAMACSLPVVASRIYGVPEVVVEGQTGLLVGPGDVGAMSAALGTLILEPALRTRMGAEGRRRFERYFSLDEKVRKVEQVYLELAGWRLS